MPYAGEIRHGRELGKTKAFYVNQKFIWRVCVFCGKGKWLPLVRGKPQRERCRECYFKQHVSLKLREHGSWKGGCLTREGYVLLRLDDDSPYLPMADSKGYIKEHRLIMAQKLNRLLARKEVVHHIDGNRSNNKIENLELISWANHSLYKQMCNDCPLRKEIKRLTKIIDNLKPKLFADDGV